MFVDIIIINSFTIIVHDILYNIFFYKRHLFFLSMSYNNSIMFSKETIFMTKLLSKIIKFTLGSALIFSLLFIPIATYESGINVTSLTIPEVDS